MDIESIINYDKEILLTLNSYNSPFWDRFMWIYTGTYVWVPLFLVLVYLIVRNNQLKTALVIFVLVALVITCADQISSSFFKPFFQRFRPTHEPEIMEFIHIVNNYRGGKYGFISSHAANSFGLFTFLSLLIKKKEFTLSILIWALLNSYSRIYLGVHYPGDIFIGALVGSLTGILFYNIYRYKRKITREYYSGKYTRTGYRISDIYIVIGVLFTTIFLIFIIALF